MAEDVRSLNGNRAIDRSAIYMTTHGPNDNDRKQQQRHLDAQRLGNVFLAAKHAGILEALQENRFTPLMGALSKAREQEGSVNLELFWEWYKESFARLTSEVESKVSSIIKRTLATVILKLGELSTEISQPSNAKDLALAARRIISQADRLITLEEKILAGNMQLMAGGRAPPLPTGLTTRRRRYRAAMEAINPPRLLRILFMHEQGPDIIDAYARSPEIGSVHALSIVYHAKESAGKALLSIIKERKALWRYEPFIHFAIYDMRLDSVDGFSDFMITIARGYSGASIEDKALSFAQFTLGALAFIFLGPETSLASILFRAAEASLSFEQARREFIRERENEYFWIAQKFSGIQSGPEEFTSASPDYSGAIFNGAIALLSGLALADGAWNLAKKATSKGVTAAESVEREVVVNSPNSMKKQGYEPEIMQPSKSIEEHPTEVSIHKDKVSQSSTREPSQAESSKSTSQKPIELPKEEPWPNKPMTRQEELEETHKLSTFDPSAREARAIREKDLKTTGLKGKARTKVSNLVNHSAEWSIKPISTAERFFELSETEGTVINLSERDYLGVREFRHGLTERFRSLLKPGGPDPAIPGQLVSDTHVGHVVAVADLMKNERFRMLPQELQNQIAWVRFNLAPLSESYNTAQGARSFAEVNTVKGRAVDRAWQKEMVELEMSVREMVNELIDLTFEEYVAEQERFGAAWANQPGMGRDATRMIPIFETPQIPGLYDPAPVSEIPELRSIPSNKSPIINPETKNPYGLGLYDPAPVSEPPNPDPKNPFGERVGQRLY